MSTDGISQSDLNGQSAAIFVVFVFVSFFVICPVQVPLLGFLQHHFLRVLQATRIIDHETSDELSKRRLHFPLSLETAPIIGVLLLLATTTIDGSTIRLGVKGDASVQPYDVLVLFISLAYIVIALDGTGALEAIAFWVSKRGGSSGPRLFAYLYAFFLLTGCIVGNDPLILSGTPFLAYLTKHTELEPTAWIFSEFMAANTASAVLVSSNPTNILITGSFNLNYLTEFTKWTILPSIIPGILNYFLLYLMFRQHIPKTLVPLKDDPWTKLRDPKGAVFLSTLMLVTIAVLVGTSFVPGHKAQVWMITAPAGVTALTFNVLSDWINPLHQKQIVEEEDFDPAAEMSTIKRESSTTDETARNEPLQDVEKSDAENDTALTHRLSSRPTSDLRAHKQPSTGRSLSSPSRPPQSSYAHRPRTLQSILSTSTKRFPRTTRTISLLPLPLLPFAICQFILVRGLSQRGWITVFSGWAAHGSRSPTSAVFLFGFVSAAFLCPLAGTNIGATILLVEVLQDPAFSNAAWVTSDDRILKGAIYATALGSNTGAFSFVFAASLAGLLWRGLLRDKGIIVKGWRFALVNFGPLVFCTGLGCAILVGQVYWFDG